MKKYPIPKPHDLQNISSPRPRSKFTAINSNKLRRSMNSFSAKQINQLIPPVNNSKLSRRIGSFTPKTLPALDSSIQIIFRIISNWGDPSKITCSEIDFLDKKSNPYSTLRIFSPESDNDKLFHKLSDGILIKPDDSSMWNFPWNSSREPLEIHFILFADEIPSYIRIWNIKTITPSNIRKFEVIIDNTNFLSAEVPIDFGIVLPLTKPGLQKNLFRPSVYSLIQDQLDQQKKIVIPSFSVKELSICFLQTYDPSSIFYGLNAIKFFDINGKPISNKMFSDISLTNTLSISSFNHALKDFWQTIDIRDMWVAKKLKGIPQVKITFSHAIQIGMMKIWNINSRDECDKYGVKNLSIRFDQNVVWSGTLSKASGILTQQTGFTRIFFVDPIVFNVNPETAW